MISTPCQPLQLCNSESVTTVTVEPKNKTKFKVGSTRLMDLKGQQFYSNSSVEKMEKCISAIMGLELLTFTLRRGAIPNPISLFGTSGRSPVAPFSTIKGDAR